MTNAIATWKANTNGPNLYSIIHHRDVLIQFLAESILRAFQWEAILVRALLDLNNTARNVSPSIEKETFPQLKRPEEIISQPCWEALDVNNVENLKTAEQAGKKRGKRKGKSALAREKRLKKKAEETARREAEEQERSRKWEELWDKKYQAEEEQNQAECCVGKGLCVAPRTQSNIWINVTRDRSIKEIHMCFKHVPVPRPKPPPLPPLKRPNPADNSAPEQNKATQIRGEKHGEKEKKKKKKKK